MAIVTNVLGQQMATDGRLVNSNVARKVQQTAVTLPSSGVAKSQPEEPNLETVKAEIERIQKDFSNSLGRKVQFNVNQELDTVVVTIVDPSSNKIIKEIPSEDIQKLHARMIEAQALLVDEKI
ncbi:MAG: flagellar protein FlaG [Spirochaetaceae bacterium]|jgi:flagellar protein FlaG|nr:flagellar protein FlaG [Spirochaetaceae bacterium]MBP5329561.1 flagellar protein FlaG [Spirochaetaceae bacterium]MBP5792998.1 flagellar protein FlaG [Spirochaetaceae bacterium]